MKSSQGLSVNEIAVGIAEEMIQNREELGIGVSVLENGATIIDAGAKSPGGIRAGVYFAKVCLGGLCDISLGTNGRFNIYVFVDNPKVACMACQFAGWSISVDKYFAMASGPARALSRVEKKLYDAICCQDAFDKAVIALETRKAPDEKVSTFIAEKCCIEPKNLYVLVAPTASIVGSVQISARVVETGVHKLHELGFDLDKIVSGFGTAPIAPVAKNDLKAMGKTNDCVLYGGVTRYFVNCEDADIERIIEKVPSCSSKDYGMPFLDTFEKYNRNFYDIDPHLFSPAEIYVNNIRTGNNFHAGKVNDEILDKSLGKW
ncbi:MAG TPA: methenyltetrahydromethanopterin cyclohydrolase [Methanocellales archaeon]|nr:methenyltetrahydromethanopterin cyclohydrolase [Methanocellales archaeon]